MASSLFNNATNGLIQMLSSLKGNPDEFYKMLMQRNPQFKQFVLDNKGKSVEEIAQKYGVNLNDLRNMMELIK